MRKLMLGLLMAIACAVPAAAQTCGDSNGNGDVTVTDGVQALRAAAGLSNSCEDGCDVDGNGEVTVTDGVNILRKAAGFPIVEACDFTGEEANSVVNPSLSIFDAMTKIPGVGSASVAAAANGCENDGTIQNSVGTTGAASSTTFTNCEIAGAVLDGTIGRAVLGSGIALAFQDFMITRIATGKSHAITGQLGVTSTDTGKRITGKLTIESSERGTFTIEFQRILLLGDGSVRQGILIFDLTDASTPRIAGIQIMFGDSDAIPVTVQLRNKQVRQLILDRTTRLLHRVL
jgi:hypothetical protein